MIKISHIVPLGSLPTIQGREFHMCLANVAIKNQQYKDFYKKEKEKGSFILLDNGAAEMDQISLSEILEVAKYINADQIVLSDSLCNCDETIEKSMNALQYYKDNGFKGTFMFVPQGHTFDEWKHCFIKMMNNKDITTFGISKFMTVQFKDSEARLNAVKFMNEIGADVEIHLLGCHENISEIVNVNHYVDKTNIKLRSADTAIAYIYAQDEKSILDGNRPSNEINFVDEHIPSNVECNLKKNMSCFDEEVSK